jgi:hypothetical protein
MAELQSIAAPFENDSERSACLVELLHLSAQLERWRELAISPEALPSDRRTDLASAAVPGDDPVLKLTRWVSLFDDELRAVFDARNRAIHGIRLGDRELRGATWLARHLLELIEPPSPA